MDNQKTPDIDYTENNGNVGHPVTNELMLDDATKPAPAGPTSAEDTGSAS